MTTHTWTPPKGRSWRLGRFLLLLVLGAAWAQAPEDLIRQGAFLEAYAVLIAQPDPQAQLMAAQAASLHASYHASSDAETVRWLQLAIQAAEQAKAQAPEVAEAHFELARARGLLAQHQGILENLNLASTLRALLETTLELDPQHADAKVALARLHFELTARGVGWLYGARRELVSLYLNEALEQEPERINFRNEVALVLIASGNAPEAQRHLSLALTLPAYTAVDRLEQARAREMLASLQAR